MSSIALKPSKNIISITILAVAIFAGGLLMMNNVEISHRDKIATGFLCDLLITFPLCYYFVIVRPLKKPVKSILLVLTICCGVAYLVLPAHQRSFILQLRKFTMAAELLFIVYAVAKIRKIKAAYKVHQLRFPDPLYNLRSSMADVFGDILPVKVLASELAVLRYGLMFWRREKRASEGSMTFSTHKESGYLAVWCILLVAILVEVVAFHLLLMRWSHIAANIVTALTAYSIIFFIADLSAIIKRKVQINNDVIILRTGLRWRAITTKNNILSAIKPSGDCYDAETFVKGAVLKSGSNLLITFKEPVIVDKLYGAGKGYKSILMSVDDVKSFITVIGLTRNFSYGIAIG